LPFRPTKRCDARTDQYRRSRFTGPRYSDSYDVADLAQALVSETDVVTVRTHERDGTTHFLLTVAPEDMGKVVGVHGRTAESLRAILRAISRKAGQRFDLEIRPDEDSQP
jgi:predicted RNA-binding protein YlqC (UPF0109 family)